MIVRNIACPECRKTGHDSSGNHLMIFGDGGKLCKHASYHQNGKWYAEGLTVNDIKTPQETIDYIRQLDAAEGITNIVREIRLPQDFLHELPDFARLWLLKYGITVNESQSFGWSPGLRRLILPVYVDDMLVYWQGRTFEPITKENPKYLNIRSQGAKHVFFHLAHPTAQAVCLVEDILSASKCGRHVNAIALLGSYFPDALLQLLKPYTKIYIWLDADKYATAVRAAKRLHELLSKPVQVVFTDHDPKEYPDSVIKEILHA